MLRLSLVEDDVVVGDVHRVLSPLQRSMLAFWGFRLDAPDRLVATPDANSSTLLTKVANYFGDEAFRSSWGNPRGTHFIAIAERRELSRTPPRAGGK